ncbi:DUF58 domain-containing protein [Oceanobacillus bengalensis]|uniref:DUF58 domain-containing protein n=1 Tax=Oceanobacillus bengalensis TaxID=1435466 RepID=A0A494YUH3_9BACI|nr:DUF58 domain-containing protein [Oceanobacillus bengalensis]RKQ13803.1 DUF58 domain-containing protein [Oceanobacillus bengalensis]
MKDKLKFTLNIAFVLLLIAVLFSYAMFQGGFVSWFLFYSLLPIIFYQFGLLLYPMKKWKVTRKLSRQVIAAGDGVTVSIDMKRKVAFPVYYCIVEEVFPETLRKMDSKQEKYYYMDRPDKLLTDRNIKKVVFPYFKKNIRLEYTIGQVPRGEHQLTAVRVRIGDVFGLVKKEHIFNVEDKLTANPTEVPLRLYEKNRSFDQGSRATSPMEVTNTNIAVGVREYEPGDKFSWIDWKQTARKNTIMTKEFEQEKGINVSLVLDHCNYSSLNFLAFEATVEITLSLMTTFRKKLTEISLLTIGGDRNSAFFPTCQDVAMYTIAKRHLTGLNASGNGSFSNDLKEQMMRLGHGDIVVVITTHLDEQFKQTILQLNKRIKSLGVILVQSKSFIAHHEQAVIKELHSSGMAVDVLTEEQLVKKPIEVSL